MKDESDSHFFASSLILPPLSLQSRRRSPIKMRNNSKSNFRFVQLAVMLAIAAFVVPTLAGQSHVRRPTRHAAVCGNPKLACKTSVTFEPHDLPFRVPRNAVILDTVPFYAIMLKSMDVNPDNCEGFVPESERLAAQLLFPDHKVFSSRCAEPGTLFYEDVTRSKLVFLTDAHMFMAIYAGATLPEARLFLEKVKASGKYPGANIRRLRTGYNGT
jgi:hypothetical protein